MKKIAGKLFVRIAAILLFMTLLCGLSACSLDKLYYAKDSDPVRSITNTLGTPLWVEVQSDGSEKLVYRVHDPMDGNYYRRYFIVKDGKVIDGGIQ
jgi:hypothetical protein